MLHQPLPLLQLLRAGLLQQPPRSSLLYRSNAFRSKLLAANVTQIVIVVAPPGEAPPRDAAVEQHLLGRVERVGARALEDAHADGGLAVEVGVRGVVLRPELDAGDVLMPPRWKEPGGMATDQVLEVVSAVHFIADLTLGLGELAGVGLQVALLNWKRMSEFSADRAGLLACQDPSVALGVMMKLAGLPRSRYASANTEDFIAQARAFETLDADTLSWIARRLSATVSPPKTARTRRGDSSR